MNYSEDTEILYRGMDIKGITENPEVAPIYNTTASVSYTHLTEG